MYGSSWTFALQFRENVAAWICFYDKKDVFKGFLGSVLRLKEEVGIILSPLFAFVGSYFNFTWMPSG